MPDKIRLALVDDHPLFLDGVRLSLERYPDLEVAAVGHSAEDALHIAAVHRPAVMVLDVRMPGGGIAAAAALTLGHPAVRVIFLTASEDEEDVTAAMAAGAAGYVLKGIAGSELVEIVRAVAAGQSYVAPSLAATLLRRLRQPEIDTTTVIGGDQLTAREDQILTLVALGMTNKEIARKLDISEKTVKHYMTLIMQKMNVRNRVEAVLRRQRHQA